MIIIGISLIIAFVLMYKNVHPMTPVLVLCGGITVALFLDMDYEVNEIKYEVHHVNYYAEYSVVYIHYEDYVKPIPISHKDLSMYFCEGYNKDYLIVYQKVAKKTIKNWFALDENYFDNDYVLELRK